MEVLLIGLGALSLTIAYIYIKNYTRSKRYVEIKNIAYQQTSSKNRAA